MVRRSRSVSALSGLVVAAVLALATGPASAATVTYPTSIAALGDSITRAYNAGGWYSDWPSRSWSTGADSAVVSHYTRLVRLNSGATVQRWNNAATGAKMSALDGQALNARTQNARYVTILMGANDACTKTESGMTPAATFGAQFRAAMNTLMTQEQPPQVLVASIPDIYRLYLVGKGSSAARNAWSSFGICQSMLANPTSTQKADVDRRARVRQRVIDFNTQLAAVCATYATCKYDGGAVFRYPFELKHLSTWDYFHPNTSGQAVLANETWKVGFWSS